MMEPDLPELPNRVALWRGDETFHLDPNGRQLEVWRDYDLFTADQMRSYALQCYRKGVEDERERCARVAESDEFYGSALQHHIAAAIRGTKTE